MLDGFASARAYQEGDFDLKCCISQSTRDRFSGSITIRPYSSRRRRSDTERKVRDMPELVSDDEDNVTEDDEADFNEADLIKKLKDC